MPEKDVLLFGPAREAYSSSVKITFPRTVNGRVIKDIIFQELYKILHLKDCSMLAINQEYVEDYDIEINMDDVDEIAILPPLSGG